MQCFRGNIIFIGGTIEGEEGGPRWIKRSGNCGVHAAFQIYFHVNFAYSCTEIPVQPQMIIIGKVIVSRFSCDTVYCATECEPPCTGSMVHDEYFKRFDGTIEKLWNFILNYLFGYRPRLGDETMSRFWIYDQTIISPMVSEPRKFILIREIALDEMRAVFRNSDNKHVAGFSLCTRRLINNSDSFVVL